MIACATCFLVEDKDGSLTAATRHHFEGKKATCDPLGVAGTPQSPMAFRRLCVGYEVVFYRRELNMLTRCSDFLLGLIGHAKEAVIVVLCIDLYEKPVVPQRYTESPCRLSGVVFWLRRLVLSFWTQRIVRRYIRVLFIVPAHPTLSTILNTGSSILEEVINGSFLLRVLASRGVGAGLDEGRRSRYSNWTLGDEAVHTDPLHEFLFNSGSASLEGGVWLELHMSPYVLKSL